MPVDRAKLEALVAEVGRFYVREKRMRRAQERILRALASPTLEQSQVDEYLKATRHYFAGFAREAKAHLGNVERRLAQVSQLQFNLSAERGVAARRIDATQGVLAQIEELAPR
ncbi:MAG TPA: hypothetical protein VKG44_00810 [Candidatus Baltobacteraceae bacterium]|nr:hypothetical protein [Candidatus Baltobacteraceae bacterium]